WKKISTWQNDTHIDTKSQDVIPKVQFENLKPQQFMLRHVKYLNSVCQHGKRKVDCEHCIVCHHGLEKSNCTKCGPVSAICQHKKERYYCRDCKGKGICKHDKRNNNCIECKKYCKHELRKEDCKDCLAFLCVHLKHKNRCRDCSKFKKLINSN
ncbi:hypothetical protein HK099_004667, partial [Clydaea vesicula]